MLNIKNPEADRLARALAQKTGHSITEVIIEALREKLIREQGRKKPQQLIDDLLQISKRCAALPEIDQQSPDEILGYDEHGLPR